jgi:hypothetical protein
MDIDYSFDEIFENAKDMLSEVGKFSCSVYDMGYLHPGLCEWALEEDVNLKFDWNSTNTARVYLRKLSDNEIVW